jgi:hypothetical protein
MTLNEKMYRSDVLVRQRTLADIGSILGERVKYCDFDA